MLKKRLILCLLLKDHIFQNSRNFSLQAVGNVHTIEQYLNFEAIDELVVLNVVRNRSLGVGSMVTDLEKLASKCFIPITAGGMVRSLDDISVLLKTGADKIVINTAALETPSFITEASGIYGSQCIVVSIDAKKNRLGQYEVFSHGGTRNTKKDPVLWAKEAEKLGAGEIFLTSIDRDGIGKGYDLELVRSVVEAVQIPVIASGGVGEFQHLVDGIRFGGASAVSAANLFHFVGHSLIKAKTFVADSGLGFPKPLWNF